MLRLLTETDIPRLLEIETSVHASPWNEMAFYNCFIAQYQCWGIEMNQCLIGFIIVSFDALNEGHILNFAVDLNWQKKGFGRALFQMILEYAAANHILRIWLEVRKSNQRAIDFYQKQGFHYVGERKNYYVQLAGNEDALIFLKEL